MTQKPDFAGWVTKNNIRCTDGVTIRQDAFADMDGAKVPMVWQHNYSKPGNILGTMKLTHKAEGVWGEGYFNETSKALDAKELVRHGDLNSMSIGARGIRKRGQDVVGGKIYEVSLVVAGANPGAKIEYAMAHSAYGSEVADEAIITTEVLMHADNSEEEGESKVAKDTKDQNEEDLDKKSQDLKNKSKGTSEEDTDDEEGNKDMEHADAGTKEKTVGEVIATMNAEQKQALEIIVASALEGKGGSDVQHSDEEGEELKHNAFNSEEDILEHAEGNIEMALNKSDINAALEAAIDTRGSLVHSLMVAGFDREEDEEGRTTKPGIDLEHGIAPAYDFIEDDTLMHADNGITNIDVLFPQTKNERGIQVYNPAGLNVGKIMSSFGTTPSTRIKNIYMDVSQEEARARGYITQNEKLESITEAFFREVTPTTIVRKVKFDRDDIEDIKENGIDMVGFIQQLQLQKLQEEIVRAAFMGDGRPATITVDGSTMKNPDKIDEKKIIPIKTDDDLFTMKLTVAKWDDFATSMTMAMPFYQGSGQPSLYMNPFDVAKLRTLKDANGRPIFGGYEGKLPTVSDIAAYLGVKEIVDYRSVAIGEAYVLNLSDYVFGRSKGGQIATFEFFDIDFNLMKYLMETRLSGALQVPKSAFFVKVTDAGDKDLSMLDFVKTGLQDTPSWTAGGEHASDEKTTKTKQSASK